MHADFRNRTWDAGTDISPEQTEFATELRVPFLTSPYPRWNYITGIVVGEGDNFPWPLSLPSEEEVTMVAEFLTEYNDHWYGANSYRHHMMEFAPYDLDGDANLAYFRKHPNGGWGYRMRTWTGPEWAPGFNDPAMPLEQVIDRRRGR